MPKSRSALYLLLTALVFAAGCSQQKSWKYDSTISLQEQAHPLGIVENDGKMWVSAPAQKKLLNIDKDGKTIDQKTDLPRPMHISSANGKIYIPLYLEDRIVTLNENEFDTISLGATPDGPAGVFVKGDTMAVADFYKHRIILQTGGQTTTFGEEGHEKGQLYYPTDVEIVGDKIYVADAYNNRAQVFSRDGEFEQIIGAQDSINVATGLTVHEGQLFVTDFFNNKILVYDLEGNLIQTLSGHFNKPTDIAVINGELYIPNYGEYSIVHYTRK